MMATKSPSAISSDHVVERAHRLLAHGVDLARRFRRGSDGAAWLLACGYGGRECGRGACLHVSSARAHGRRRGRPPSSWPPTISVNWSSATPRRTKRRSGSPLLPEHTDAARRVASRPRFHFSYSGRCVSRQQRLQAPARSTPACAGACRGIGRSQPEVAREPAAQRRQTSSSSRRARRSPARRSVRSSFLSRSIWRSRRDRRHRRRRGARLAAARA